MLKINSKKKVNKPANTLKPQFTQKKPLVQPEWNSTQSDLDRYRLSKAEQVQKKVSMISKHRYEAKELWLQRQEKLKKGIVDEETQTVMETCLLTKRPPERNTKNLSYFVKDDTYADYLNQAYEESEEKRLCMADLHQQEKSESKPKIEKSRIETTTTKQKNNQDLDEGDDFIKKVNESLKDARDFMTKMERYPSLSNPEKALKALTSVNKENHSRSSSSHAQSKPKSAAVNSSSTNLKSSLNNSQNGKQRNLSSSSGFKDNSPQLPNKKTNKVEETLPKPQPQYEEESEEEEVSAPKEQNVEKGEDIGNYFKSLNQIEDTIKFLEENIMGGGSSVPENKVQEDFDYKPPTALQRFGFEDLSIKSPIMNNKIQEYSPHKIEEKDEEEDSYFKQRQPSPKHHSDIKHHDSDHEDDDKDHDKDLSHDDEQISFALTMRSNDQTERNYDHDHHHDHGYASKLFGFNDVISPITTTLQKPFPIPIQTEYPQAIFENKAIQERTTTQNVQPTVKPVVQHSPPKAQQVQEEEEEDEEDFNIERIKGLLQATKLEIDKMNTNQMEAYNNSYKTALEDMDKENVSINKGFSTLPKYNNFDATYKNEYPMPVGKKIEVVKNEAFVTVKQPFNALWENQRRVLADVNNTRNMFDDDIPAPQTLEIKKQAVAMNYSPKKVDDVPFNFRSFRK